MFIRTYKPENFWLYMYRHLFLSFTKQTMEKVRVLDNNETYVNQSHIRPKCLFRLDRCLSYTSLINRYCTLGLNKVFISNRVLIYLVFTCDRFLIYTGFTLDRFMVYWGITLNRFCVCSGFILDRNLYFLHYRVHFIDRIPVYSEFTLYRVHLREVSGLFKFTVVSFTID